MKVTANKFRTFVSITAAILGMTLEASPSVALDNQQWRKLLSICQNKSCEPLTEAFIASGIAAQHGGNPLSAGGDWDPETPEEKALKAAQARAHQREEYSVMRQGESLWWMNPSMVEAVSVRSFYKRPYLDDDLSGPNWSVRYTIRAEAAQGTKLVREFVGNCATRKERKTNTFLTTSPMLYYLGTSEIDAKGNVLRQKKPQNPPLMTLKDHDEMYSLQVACYLAYDFPLIKTILSRGAWKEGGATFERTNSTSTTLPEPATPSRVIDLTSLDYPR